MEALDSVVVVGAPNFDANFFVVVAVDEFARLGVVIVCKVATYRRFVWSM